MPAAPTRTDEPARIPARRFRRVALAALVCNYAIVLTGATVRLTGSGLGCPDWPSCNGSRPLPEWQYHQLIEFFNRMISTPTLLFSVLAAVMAWRLCPRRRDLRAGTSLVLGGVLLQVLIGGLTVLSGLHPLIVAGHFVVSTMILGFATFVVYASRRPRVRMRYSPAALPAVALLSTALVVIVTGVLTTAAGPHSGGVAADGGQLARFGDAQLAVSVHARLVYLFAVLVVAVTLFQRRTRKGARDLSLLTALVVVQIALGELQYRTGLPWQLVLAHVATAMLVWVVTCWIAVSAATASEARRRRLDDAWHRQTDVEVQATVHVTKPAAGRFDTVGS